MNIDAGVPEPQAKLLGYGAVIISFIGAVHWGLALTSASSLRSKLFLYSVVPALVAWVWLFFSDRAGLIGMALTIIAMYFIDRKLLSTLVPPAYLRMRAHLTIIVSVSLLLAAIRAV